MVRRFLFFFALCLPVVGWGQTAAQLLQQKLDNFQSLSTNFEQTIQGDDGIVFQRSWGTLEIQRPGKFRWEVTKPIRQLIVTDGTTVWIDEPDLQQVTIRNLKLDSQQTPVLLLTNHTFLENRFTVSQLSSQSSTQRFLLIPKNKQETFEKIILTFQKNHLSKMEFSNQLGQKTQLFFSDVKINPALDAQLFVFTLPKGVDVIDQRTS